MDALRRDMEVVREAVDASEAMEADMAMNTDTTQASVAAQVGTLIKKRNLKLGEVIRMWGEVDKLKFRSHIRDLGVTANDAAIDETFEMIDDDGGGSLDTQELKLGLKKIIGASVKFAADAAAYAKQREKRYKLAVKKQAAFAAIKATRAELARQKEEEQKQEQMALVRAAAEAAAFEQQQHEEAEAMRAKRKAERAKDLQSAAKLPNTAAASKWGAVRKGINKMQISTELSL